MPITSVRYVGNASATGEPSENTFQYTGRENDGTGLYYYRARLYNPQMQRFLSEDPIGLAASVGKVPSIETNLYRYAAGNPANYIDPLGLYGTKDCTYYRQACKTNGGFYECHIVERACNAFPKNNETSNCIRQCLQEKHKSRQPEGICSKEGQTGWSEFVPEHAFCFEGCLKNPENPYNPNGPDLPDKNIRLY